MPPGGQQAGQATEQAATHPPQAYLNVEAVKGVTRAITANDANQARTAVSGPAAQGVCCGFLTLPWPACCAGPTQSCWPPALCRTQFVPMVAFECRGLEPVSYRPDVFIVKSKSGATFEADLSEGEWADFDEKLNESISIMGISSEFRTHKGK